MPTTQLFIELLVIGAGAVLWIGLVLATLVGIDVTKNLEPWINPAALPAFLVAAYVLGILVDRAADWSSDRFDKWIRKKNLEHPERFFIARRKLIVFAPSLWNYIEYGRSRLRICRGWVLNFICIAIVLWIHDGLGPAHLVPHSGARWAVTGVLLAFAGFSALSWYRLTAKEYIKIERQAAWIEGGGLSRPFSLEIESSEAPKASELEPISPPISNSKEETSS